MKSRLLFVSFLFLFPIIVNAQYSKLHDFSGVNGNSPSGSLFSDGTFLYGMTERGGANDSGTVFKIKPDGTGYSILLDFSFINGYHPLGDLISDGTYLYGMTAYGGIGGAGCGTGGCGTIFKIKPDGTGYAKLNDFFFSGFSGGSSPRGSLISDGTYLYGMTAYGGANSLGTIFKIKLDGTGYVDLLDFSGTLNGGNPKGSLISDGTYLYGMTQNGGLNNLGVIFKIIPDGTGYDDLLDFSGTANGQYPNGSLISDGTYLYGMTFSGGTNAKGNILKIKTDGTGYSNMLNFSGVTNGRGPAGSLFSDGAFLYGMTQQGGINDLGAIFKIKTDGTGYVKLLDFSGTANGSSPTGSFISDGTFLYGMTASGGANNMGVIFKYGIATGLAENYTETDFTMYPNPSNGLFNVQMKQALNVQVKIYNMYGECVYQKINASSNFPVELSNQPNGIYFVSITYENGTAIKKISISK